MENYYIIYLVYNYIPKKVKKMKNQNKEKCQNHLCNHQWYGQKILWKKVKVKKIKNQKKVNDKYFI